MFGKKKGKGEEGLNQHAKMRTVTSDYTECTKCNSLKWGYREGGSDTCGCTWVRPVAVVTTKIWTGGAQVVSWALEGCEGFVGRAEGTETSVRGEGWKRRGD